MAEESKGVTVEFTEAHQYGGTLCQPGFQITVPVVKAVRLVETLRVAKRVFLQNTKPVEKSVEKADESRAPRPSYGRTNKPSNT